MIGLLFISINKQSGTRRLAMVCVGQLLLLLLLLLALTAAIVCPAQGGPRFTLAPLPYDYSALEPHIDTPTMQLHHDKHHQAYTDKFNQAIAELEAAGVPPFTDGNVTAEYILASFNSIAFPFPRWGDAVRNHGGGYVNHNMFWRVMIPGGATEPHGVLAKVINDSFGSLDNFKESFNQAAMAVFGSGWVWLVVADSPATLRVVSTRNQDSPLMLRTTPILCLDVWEHAYYLLRHNRRAEYIEAWWNVVNWDIVQEYYERAWLHEHQATKTELPPNDVVIV